MPSMTVSIRPLQLRWLGTFLAVLCLGGAAFAQTAHFSGIVNTAGSGFSVPYGVAVDASGDVFVADEGHNAVKEIVAVNGKVSSTSTIITVGSGFSQPQGVAVDASGDVFVADAAHNAVKEIVAVNGQVTSSSTVIPVGSGFSGPTGVAVDTSGNVFVADTNNNAVKQIVAGTGGAASGKVSSSSTVITVGSGFNGPKGVAVDTSGNVFVADTSNNAVKEIVAVYGPFSSTSAVHTVGSGFSLPAGVAADATGDVFVADTSNNAVKEIVPVNGQVSSTSTVITLGIGFSLPAGVAVGAGRNVFAGDTNNSAVKQIEPVAANFGTVNVASASATTLIPFTFDSAGTPSGWNVFTQGAQGLDFTEVTGSTTCSSTTDYAVGTACSVAVRFSPRHPGLLMGAVQLMDSGGNVIATAHLRGIGSGPQLVFPSNNTPSVVGSGIILPSGLAVDASGDVFVADQRYRDGGVYEIVAVNGQVSSGSTVKTVSSSCNSYSCEPQNVAVDASGDVFVTSENGMFEIVAVNGQVGSGSTVKTVFSGFGGSTSGVAVDASGDVFVTVWNRAVYEIVAVNGQVSSTSTVITVGSGIGEPKGVAVDASGNVFVADGYSPGVVKEVVAVNGQVSSSSTVITVGNGFSEPFDLAVDARGDVFVTDVLNSNDRALKEIVAVNGQVSSTSTVITLGSGFSYAAGVAVDASGNVFFSNFTNGMVIEMPLATPPSLSFAGTAVGSTSSDSPRTVQIKNDGNADLTFTGLSYPTDFPSAGSGTNPCNGTTVLSAGDECDLEIDFSPLITGMPLSEHVTLTDNALNVTGSQQSVPVSGSAGPPTPASITLPTPGSTFTGPVETFVWTVGIDVTTYELRVGTTGVGSNDIYDSGSTTAVSVSVNNIPTNSAKVYVQLLSSFNGSPTHIANYTFTEAPPSPAVLTSPVGGSTLTSFSETFTWTAGNNSTVYQAYELRIGTNGVGSNNVYDSGSTTATSVTASNIPTAGAKLYVQLLSYYPSYATQSVNYTFTEATPIPAALISPTRTGLTNSSETFTWTAGVVVSAYELRVGTTGAGSNDIYDSGLTAATSALVTGIPVNGATVYVQLLSYFPATPTYFANYTFTAGTPTPAVLILPAPGTALDSPSVSFAWMPGVAVSSYELRVGTIGVGSNNVFSSSTMGNSDSCSRNLPQNEAASICVVVNGIPYPGATVYVQLVSNFYGAPAQTANYTFTEEVAPGAGSLTSPAVGTTLTGSTQTFAWTIGGYDLYQACVGTTGLGSCNLYDSGLTTHPDGSVTLSNLPTDGTTVYVWLHAFDSYLTAIDLSLDYAFTASGGPPAPAALTAPTQGTTLTGSSQTFTWSPGIGVTRYELWVGTTGPSSSNVYNSGWLKGTSVPVSNIPTNGGMLYVRLCSKINGNLQFADYTLVESGGPTAPAALTAPTGTTLSGSSQTFTWSAGVGVTRYALRVGTAGVGSTNIYKPGSTIATSATVDNIPTNGGTVYVGLSSEINGVWQFTGYTFLASGEPPIPAALTAPTGTLLAGSNQTFTWTIGSGVSDYQLWVGTTGVSSSNLYNSHWTTATSATVSDIPANGGMVYVRLYSKIDGAWQFTDYTFTEPGTAVPAALTSPTGTTLTGSSQTFTWSAGVGVTRYELRVGTPGVASIDIYKPGSTLATSATVNNIPTNGGTVYVRLASEINGVWQFTFYTFLESGGPPVPAVLTAPTGTTFTGPSVSFAWTAGSGVSDYELWVGTTGPSSSNVYRSPWLTATSATVGSIPTSGGTVYVRLCSLINGAWQIKDYTFIESGGPPTAAALTSPTGTTLTGSSQTFTWSAGVGVSRYALRVGTTGWGSSNIYKPGSTLATSATVDNIPTDGGPVYVGLSSEINGVWHYAAYTFTAP